MLDIVANYHDIQFHRKRMIQTQKNVQKSRFNPGLGQLEPNSGRQILFSLRQSLDIMVSYHHVKY